jgi:hypothetical protein
LAGPANGIEIFVLKIRSQANMGDDVKLKKSGYVEVTITEDPKGQTAAIGEDNRPNRLSPETRYLKLAKAA